MGKKITALAPWYGSNRMNAELPAKFLAGCEWIGVPFAGGMCEVPYFTARTIMVNDAHEHIINLAIVACDPVYGPKLYRQLRRQLFHPYTLEVTQIACATYDSPFGLGGDMEARCRFAVDYFITLWMSRSSVAGTDGEFDSSLALRWTASGGDSAKRYHSAIKFLNAFRRAMRHCTFSAIDVFEFLLAVKDLSGHGIYADPPWPDDGDNYRHKFTPVAQRHLATFLATFQQTRVVVRYGDHPLIRELYPVDKWDWHMVTGRTQANKGKAEVLLVRKVAS